MNIKVVRIALPLAALLLAAPAMADSVIYQQDFNSYADGTLMTAVPGWYSWGGVTPTIVGGKAVPGGSWDFLLDMTDVFGYGNTQARIEFDAISKGGEFNAFFAPGSASATSFNYGEAMGMQHGDYGTAYLYAFNQGGWSAPSPTMTFADGFPGVHHWVFDLTKSGTQITWTAGYDGNPFFAVPKVLNVTDASGLNTMEWNGLSGVGQTLDNIVITAIGVGGWDFLPGDFNKDGEVGPED
ncbi:MAG: hypothetical protein NTV86_23065, partial [Planctomycetota bacterium]|nr:hypothetical protein [Planctomycetota bacterium]